MDKRHPEKISTVCAAVWTDCPDKDDSASPKFWDDWLERLTCPKRWICQLSLRWVGQLSLRVVLQKTTNGSWGDPIIMGKSNKMNFLSCLVLMMPTCHYVVLVPTWGRDSMPMGWLLYHEEDDLQECS